MVAFWTGSLRADALAENSITRSSGTEVFRFVGADGVVTFNDYGAGEALTLDGSAELSEEQIAIVRARQQDILELAKALADERLAREADRLAARERRQAVEDEIERERLTALQSAESVFYPARWPLYSPFDRARRGNSGWGRRFHPYVYAPESPNPRQDAPKSRTPSPLVSEPAQWRMIEPGFSRDR